MDLTANTISRPSFAVASLRPVFEFLSWAGAHLLVVGRFKSSVLTIHAQHFPWIAPPPHRLFQNLLRDLLILLTGLNPYPVFSTPSTQQMLNRMQKGGLLVTAHLSNYELLGSLLVQSGIPLIASHLPFASPVFERLLCFLRQRSGNNAPATPPTPRQALSLIRQGQLIGFLADQAPGGGRAASLPFLGLSIRINALPDFLIRHSGTPVYIAWMEYHSQGYLISAQILTESTPTSAPWTTSYHDWLSTQIYARPSQWYGWIHRRWKFGSGDIYSQTINANLATPLTSF